MSTRQATDERERASGCAIAGLAVVAGLIVVTVVWLFPSGEAPPAPPAPGPGAGGAGRITVTDTREQRIEGWGMTVLGTGERDPIVSGIGLSPRRRARLDRLIFDRAAINLVRVFGPSPSEGSRVRVWSRSDQRLEFMRRVERYGVRFMLTGAGAPPPMRAGGSPTGSLVPGRERAYAGFLLRNLEVAERAGAHFDWVAVGNEPDIGDAGWVAMSAEQAAAVDRELAEGIRASGLTTKLVLGDNQGWARTYEYARLALEQPGVAELARVVASHDYSGATAPIIERVSELARDAGLSTWMTEWTGGCAGGECPDDETIDFALPWATRITFDLAVADAGAWFMLQAVPPSTHGADSGIAVRSYGEPQRPYYLTKRFSVWRQFSAAAPPGARVVGVRTELPELAAVAFRRPRLTTLVVTNREADARPARVDLGAQRGALTVRRTSADEGYEPVERRRYRGRPARLTFPARSVSTVQVAAER